MSLLTFAQRLAPVPLRFREHFPFEYGFQDTLSNLARYSDIHSFTFP